MTRLILGYCLVLFLISGTQAQTYIELRKAALEASEHGDFPKAIDLSKRALEKAAKDRKCSKEDRLMMASEQASYYLFDEQSEKGLSLFKNLFEELQTGEPLPDAELGLNFHFGLGLLFLGNYSEAEACLNKTIALRRQGRRMEAEDELSCLQALGVCAQYRYDFGASEALFLQAEHLCRKHGYEKTNRWAELQSRMALLYVDMQLNYKALECYRKAERTYQQNKDTVNPQYPVFLLEYGTALADGFDYDKALDLTFKAKNIDKFLSGENSQAYAADLNNLGFIYNRLNRIAETEQFYKQSLAIKKTLPFQRLESYLNSLNNLMVFYANTGREEEAKDLAAEIETALKGKDLTDTLKRAVFANNLAIHYKDWGNFEKSHYYFKQTLGYYEAVYGPNNAFEGQIYMDMGTLFMVEGKWTELNKSLTKAAEVYDKNKQEESVNSIGNLCNLAIILKEINKPSEGVKYANKALQLIEKLNVKQQDILEQVYLTKAQLAADLNYVQESIDFFNKYLDLKYQTLEKNFSYMTETEKLFFLEEFEKEIRNYYSVILNNIKDYPELIKALLDFRLKTKSLLLNNLSKIHEKARQMNSPELNAKILAMRVKRESFTKLMNFNTDQYPTALQEAGKLKEEADQLEKEISYTLTANSLERENTIDWRQVQKSIKPGEAAVEIFQSYLVYDNNQGTGTNYTFLILKDTGDPIAVSIDRPANWESQVLTSYRNCITQMKNDPSLYARLWQLVAEQIKDCRTVFVSPDGVFNQINLNTLFHPQTGKFVIEETEIHILSSLRNIERVRQNSSAKLSSAVLVGNPRFDLDLTKTGVRANNLLASAKRGAYGFVMTELPGTKTEIQGIEKLITQSGGRVKVLSEESATESNLKSLQGPSLLHIATHGFFLEDVKDDELTGYARLEKEYYKNPMLRSGIFLSGSNNTYSLNTDNISSINSFEDGMLTAYEAMNLNLEGTQLVVLSACETGLGKVKNGEGVFGLQRAFKLAGAASTMMSLWSVDDEATKELMTRFYALWIAGSTMFQAFRNAQLELKQTFPAPVYWGAFVLYDR